MAASPWKERCGRGWEEAMRRSWMLGVSLVAIAASSAARAEDKHDCLEHKDDNVRIQGCSALILHDPRDAVAFHNRGLAYVAKDDIDRAIADYTRAIELNPNYGPAFEARGRAYARKGDYIRAIADVTRASELAPKVADVVKTTTMKTQPSPKGALAEGEPLNRHRWYNPNRNASRRTISAL